MKYWVIVFVLIVIGAFCVKFYFIENVTGYSVSSGIVTLTKVGAAGIQMADDSISFGSGYVNGCEYAIVNSNGSETCWNNMSSFILDTHSISNNGSSFLNITASLDSLSNAEEFFCGSTCDYTNNAQINVYSENSESNSCIGLASSTESIADYDSLQTIVICDYFDFADASDSINVYVELYVPKDANVGNKSFLINYEAVAY